MHSGARLIGPWLLIGLWRLIAPWQLAGSLCSWQGLSVQLEKWAWTGCTACSRPTACPATFESSQVTAWAWTRAAGCTGAWCSAACATCCRLLPQVLLAFVILAAGRPASRAAGCAPGSVRSAKPPALPPPPAQFSCRGAVSAAPALLADDRPWEKQGRDAPYVSFAWKMTNTLREAGVIPVLVFDGCRLPAKAATNAARRRRREEARERAARLRAEGRDQEAEAVLMQCIGVTPEMGQELIVKLR